MWWEATRKYSTHTYSYIFSLHKLCWDEAYICLKLDALLFIFHGGFNWLRGVIFCLFAHSGLAAELSHFQFSDRRLNHNSLRPFIVLALVHLSLCLGQVRPQPVLIDPNSCTTFSLYFCLFHCLPSPQPGAITAPRYSLALFTQNAKCLHPNPLRAGDLGFLNWNRRQIKKKSLTASQPPTQPAPSSQITL